MARWHLPETDTLFRQPLIDSDPHMSRVLRYMRTSDYAIWGGSTILAPAALYAFGSSSPVVALLRA